MKIAMFEGYGRPRHHHRKHHRKHKHMGRHRKHRRYGAVSATTKARRQLFGKVAKVCLIKGVPKSKKGQCMSIGLKKGIEAARKFVR